LRGVGVPACPPAEGGQVFETEPSTSEIGFVPPITASAPSEDRATLSPAPESAPSRPLIPDPRPPVPPCYPETSR
jgi:hypothetical protein